MVSPNFEKSPYRVYIRLYRVWGLRHKLSSQRQAPVKARPHARSSASGPLRFGVGGLRVLGVGWGFEV